MTSMGKKPVVFTIGAACAIVFAGAANAGMRGPDDARLILVQNQNQGDLSPEELELLKKQRKEKNREERSDRGERRERGQDRQGAKQEEPVERGGEKRRERKDADREDRRERKNADRKDRRERGGDDRREQTGSVREERPGRGEERRERKNADREDRGERRNADDRDDNGRKEKLQRAAQTEQDRIRRERERLEAEEKERNDRIRRAREEREERGQNDRRKNLRTQQKRLQERVEEQDISREELIERRRERREFTRDDLGDVIRKRVERREKDGRIIIEEPGNRRIIRDRGRVIIENDDAERLRGRAKDVDVKKGPRGQTRTTITRRNGTQIITVKNRDGEVVRRIKRLRNGREIVLFNNEIRRGKRNHNRDRSGARLFIDLPDLRRDRSRREYYVYADRADEDEIEEILSAPPIEEFEEDYTLDEIRYSPDIRARLRKLNINTITFATGSWEIADDQIRKLEVVARVINRIIDRDPEQMFLFSGHTDAIGSEENNLTLSDHRVETVARIMTDEFGVPPENIVTQGYGESDLLIDTDEAEAANRRVEFMRITPALAQYDDQ